ncbi:carbohydrate binding domain-containing protein [Streptomyces sp. NBC_01283]|uniref:carbohydrate binding domain-containing protein n=1 Tax=Streptomyces sp. NBC_01283 TaxID=2903812 RepID=UPI00352CB057|nr:carbohydrate binding domain-containing protein [Streptomyces sp. NBC_01283]
MARAVVEAAFGSTMSTPSPTWTEITEYADNVGAAISITRGASDELQDISAGTCSLTLDNSDGRFTSGLASGAYYPNIRKNVPLRVRVVSCDRNLVTNPDFEAGLTDWSKTASPSWTVDATRAKRGTQSVRMTWGAPTGQSLYTQLYGLDIGMRYTVSAYVWVAAGAPAMECRVEGVAVGAASTLTDTWQRISLTFTATATQHRLALQQVGTPTVGTQCWVDAVQVWEGAAALPLNHLANGDFETSVANWASSGSPSVARSTVRAQRGTGSMLVTWAGVDNQSVTCDSMVGMIVGQQYTFSAWVWVPAGHTAVRLTVAGGNLGPPSTLVDQWERISITWTATATSHQVRIRHSTIPSAGHMSWMDAAQVEEGSTPTTYSPLEGAQLHARFFGMVNDWPTKWKGLYSTASIVCTDTFKTLARQESLQPMLVEEVLLDRPAVYYPLGEAAESTTAGDLSGSPEVGTLSIVQAGSGGTLTFGDGQGPAGAGDMPTPTFTPSGISAGKYLTANLGQGFQDANVLFRARTECWFSTSQDGRVLMALTSLSHDVRLIISLESGTGKAKIEHMADGIASPAIVIATPNLADGQLHHIHYHELNQQLYVDGVLYSAVTSTAVDLRLLYVGGYAGTRLWSGTISHLAVYLRAITSAEIIPHYTTGSTQHIGESAAVRLARIASYVPVPVTTQGSIFDGMAAQSALGNSPLSHLKEIETTESGKLLADRGTAGLIYQARDVRYNQVSAVSLAFADLETTDLEVADDDQKMVNTITASRPGGATQRVVDQAARDTYGPYEKPLDLLKSSDLKVLDAANWLISRYADPPTEIRQVPVDGYTLPLATYRALLAADVSTALTLTGLPEQAPAPTASLTAEGYTETITRGRHLLDFHTSRAQTDTVWVLDDPVYSVLGSTTRLAY